MAARAHADGGRGARLRRASTPPPGAARGTPPRSASAGMECLDPDFTCRDERENREMRKGKRKSKEASE